MNKDNINPPHYKVGGMETIDFVRCKLTKEEFRGFCKGLIIKYVTRADYKNSLEDYKKAQWYLNYLIEVMEHDANSEHLSNSKSKSL